MRKVQGVPSLRQVRSQIHGGPRKSPQWVCLPGASSYKQTQTTPELCLQSNLTYKSNKSNRTITELTRHVYSKNITSKRVNGRLSFLLEIFDDPSQPDSLRNLQRAIKAQTSHHEQILNSHKQSHHFAWSHLCTFSELPVWPDPCSLKIIMALLHW